MDRGLQKAIKDLVEEAAEVYDADLLSADGRKEASIFTYNVLMGLMPFDSCAIRSSIKQGLALAFGFQIWNMRHILQRNNKRYKEIEFYVKHWVSTKWDVGTVHYVRNLEWFGTQSYEYKKLGFITKENEWKKRRYSERLDLAGKAVTITARNGKLFKIAQDGGVNDWYIFELMGVNEGEQENKERN